MTIPDTWDWDDIEWEDDIPHLRDDESRAAFAAFVRDSHATQEEIEMLLEDV